MHTARHSGRSARPTTVTFDVGGTLIHPWPSPGAVYAEVARSAGHTALAPEVPDYRFKQAWRARTRFGYRRADWEALVDEVFRGLVQPPPSESFFATLYDAFADPERWRIYPDAVPCLERLATAGLRLGLISNWDDRLRPLLRRLHLDRYFESVVISCEVGFEKPSPVIFEHAARQLGLPAEAVLHVGDCSEADVRGATSAGFRALLLDRAAIVPSETTIPSLDYVLADS